MVIKRSVGGKDETEVRVSTKFILTKVKTILELIIKAPIRVRLLEYSNISEYSESD